MAVKGLEAIDETVQQTHSWINEAADTFHGTKHQGLQILRAFLHTLRDHLPVDESAQLAAQLPLLIRGIYYEGWDPTKTLQHERTAEAFLGRMVRESGVREMDARDAVRAAAEVLRHNITFGEMQDVYGMLPAHVRELLD